MAEIKINLENLATAAGDLKKVGDGLKGVVPMLEKLKDSTRGLGTQLKSAAEGANSFMMAIARTNKGALQVIQGASAAVAAASNLSGAFRNVPVAEMNALGTASKSLGVGFDTMAKAMVPAAIAINNFHIKPSAIQTLKILSTTMQSFKGLGAAMRGLDGAGKKLEDFANRIAAMEQSGALKMFDKLAVVIRRLSIQMGKGHANLVKYNQELSKMLSTMRQLSGFVGKNVISQVMGGGPTHANKQQGGMAHSAVGRALQRMVVNYQQASGVVGKLSAAGSGAWAVFKALGASFAAITTALFALTFAARTAARVIHALIDPFVALYKQIIKVTDRLTVFRAVLSSKFGSAVGTRMFGSIIKASNELGASLQEVAERYQTVINNRTIVKALSDPMGRVNEGMVTDLVKMMRAIEIAQPDLAARFPMQFPNIMAGDERSFRMAFERPITEAAALAKDRLEIAIAEAGDNENLVANLKKRLENLPTPEDFAKGGEARFRFVLETVKSDVPDSVFDAISQMYEAQINRIKNGWTLLMEVLGKFGAYDAVVGIFQKIGTAMLALADSKFAEDLGKWLGVFTKDLSKKLEEAVKGLFRGLPKDADISDIFWVAIQNISGVVAKFFVDVVGLITKELDPATKSTIDAIVGATMFAWGLLKLVGNTLMYLWNLIMGIFRYLTGTLTALFNFLFANIHMIAEVLSNPLKLFSGEGLKSLGKTWTDILVAGVGEEFGKGTAHFQAAGHNAAAIGMNAAQAVFPTLANSRFMPFDQNQGLTNFMELLSNAAEKPPEKLNLADSVKRNRQAAINTYENLKNKVAPLGFTMQAQRQQRYYTDEQTGERRLRIENVIYVYDQKGNLMFNPQMVEFDGNEHEFAVTQAAFSGDPDRLAAAESDARKAMKTQAHLDKILWDKLSAELPKRQLAAKADKPRMIERDIK